MSVIDRISRFAKFSIANNNLSELLTAKLRSKALIYTSAIGITALSNGEASAASAGFEDIQVKTMWHRSAKPPVVPSGWKIQNGGSFSVSFSNLVPGKQHFLNLQYYFYKGIAPTYSKRSAVSIYPVVGGTGQFSEMDVSQELNQTGGVSKKFSFVPESSSITFYGIAGIGHSILLSTIEKPLGSNISVLPPSVQNNGDILLTYNIENTDFKPHDEKTLKLELAVHNVKPFYYHVIFDRNISQTFKEDVFLKKITGPANNFSLGTHTFKIYSNSAGNYVNKYDLLKSFVNRFHQKDEPNESDNENSIALAECSIDQLGFDGKGGLSFIVKYKPNGMKQISEIPVKIGWSTGTSTTNWEEGWISEVIPDRTCGPGEKVTIPADTIKVPYNNNKNLNICIAVDPTRIVPQKQEQILKRLEIPQLSDELAQAPIAATSMQRVKLWLKPHETYLLQESQKANIDPRAITAAIAWEAIFNVHSTYDLIPNRWGPGKIHWVNTNYKDLSNVGFYEIAREAEDLAFINPPASSVVDRFMITRTPRGAIRYIAGIMNAFASHAEILRIEGKPLFVRNRPDILCSWYHGYRPNNDFPDFEKGIYGLGQYFSQATSYSPKIIQKMPDGTITMGYWTQQNIAGKGKPPKPIDTLLSATYDPKSRNRAVPKARKDLVSVPKTRSLLVDILANDGEEGNRPLGIASISIPKNGTARIENGKVLYTPSLGFKGKDFFYYTNYDNQGLIPGEKVEVDVVEPTPDTPSSVKILATTQTTAKLQWQDTSDNEDKFVIETRKPGGSWTFKENVPPNTTEALIESLIPNQPYEARVVAVNVDGGSSISNSVSFVTKRVMTTPTNLRIDALSPNSLYIAWDFNDPSANRLQLSHRIAGAQDWKYLQDQSISDGRVILHGIPASTRNEFRLRAVYKNADGSEDAGSWSELAAFTTPDHSPVASIFASVISNSAIQIGWEFNINSISRFQLMRREVSAGTWIYLMDPPANSRTFIDSGLQANKQYEYRLRPIYPGEEAADWKQTGIITTQDATPVAPGAVQVLSASQTTARLQWQDSSDNEAKFIIEIRKPGNSWSFKENVPPNTTDALIEFLSPNQPYEARVIAVNRDGISSVSGSVAFTTKRLMTTPSEVSVVALSPTSIIVDWKFQDTSASRLQLEYRIPDVQGWQYLQDPAAQDAEVELQGLLASTVYEFRLRAVYKNADGSEDAGSWSETVSFKTPDFLAVKSASASVLSATEILIQFGFDGSGHNRFQLQRLDVATGNWIYLSDPSSTERSFKDSGLKDDKEYKYRVRAIYPGEQVSAWQSTAIVKTQQVPPAPLAAPHSLSATAVYSRDLQLNWLHGLTEGQFIVDQWTASTGWFRAKYLDARSRNTNISGLQPSTHYQFAIRYLAPDGRLSEISNVIGLYTLSGIVESPSTLRSNIPGPNNVHLEWNFYSSAANFIIEKWSASQGWHRLATIGGNLKAYDATGLSPSTQYQFAIRAIMPSGELSEPSNVIVVQTSSGTPASPNDLHRGETGRDWFDIIWNDNANNETHYKVLVKPEGGSFNLSENVPADTRKARIEYVKQGGSRLKPNTLYTIRVLATNGYGDSAYDEVQIRTKN
jgi:hypothetical protein